MKKSLLIEIGCLNCSVFLLTAFRREWTNKVDPDFSKKMAIFSTKKYLWKATLSLHFRCRVMQCAPDMYFVTLKEWPTLRRLLQGRLYCWMPMTRSGKTISR